MADRITPPAGAKDSSAALPPEELGFPSQKGYSLPESCRSDKPDPQMLQTLLAHALPDHALKQVAAIGKNGPLGIFAAMSKGNLSHSLFAASRLSKEQVAIFGQLAALTLGSAAYNNPFIRSQL